MATTKDALKLLATLPRVTLNNLKGSRPKKASRSLVRKRGLGDRGQTRHGTLPRIGFEGGQTPFYLKISKEPYYKEHSQRKEYVPLSLLQLQRMIDLKRLDTDRPIDLASLCNTKLIKLDERKRQYGIHITSEGADIFNSQIDLEVQWIDEVALAALERAGSKVTTRYFDLRCLRILADTEKFFWSARPIPTAKTPTSDLLEYYISAKSRGYLANPAQIEAAKLELAQKYGYQPKQWIGFNKHGWETKDPLQIFYGLEPGWIVNMTDRCIHKPISQQLKEFYATEMMH